MSQASSAAPAEDHSHEVDNEDDVSDLDAEDKDETNEIQVQWSGHVRASCESFFDSVGLELPADERGENLAASIERRVRSVFPGLSAGRHVGGKVLSTLKHLHAMLRSFKDLLKIDAVKIAVGVHYMAVLAAAYEDDLPKELLGVHGALDDLAEGKRGSLLAGFPELYAGDSQNQKRRAPLRTSGSVDESYTALTFFVVLYFAVIFERAPDGRLRVREGLNLDDDMADHLALLRAVLERAADPNASAASAGSGDNGPASQNRGKKSPEMTGLVLRLFEGMLGDDEVSRDIYHDMTRSLSHRDEFESARQTGDRWVTLMGLVNSGEFKPAPRFNDLSVPFLPSAPRAQYILKSGADAEGVWRSFRGELNRVFVNFTASGQHDPSSSAAVAGDDDENDNDDGAAASAAAAAGEPGTRDFCTNRAHAREALEYALRVLVGGDARDAGAEERARALVLQIAGTVGAVTEEDGGNASERKRKRRQSQVEIVVSSAADEKRAEYLDYLMANSEQHRPNPKERAIEKARKRWRENHEEYEAALRTDAVAGTHLAKEMEPRLRRLRAKLERLEDESSDSDEE